MLVPLAANQAASRLPATADRTTPEAITFGSRLGRTWSALSNEKRLDERAHFPPGIGAGEVTGSRRAQGTALDVKRFLDQEPGVQRQEVRDRLFGIGHLYVLIRDRAVAEARTAPLARIRLDGAILAVLRDRARAASARPQWAAVHKRLGRNCRCIGQAEIRASQEDGRQQMNRSFANCSHATSRLWGCRKP
jgi:hypothetical protein